MSGSLLFTRFIYAHGVLKLGGQSGQKHLTGHTGMPCTCTFLHDCILLNFA